MYKNSSSGHASQRINYQLKSDIFSKDYHLQTNNQYDSSCQHLNINLNEFKYNPRGIVLCILNITCIFLYFAQRFYYMQCYKPEQRWFPIFCSIVEFFYMSSMLLYSFYLIVKPVHQTTPQKDPFKQYIIRVLIPCYKEDQTIIFKTLQHAFQMIIPQNCELQIYLCDDSNDPSKDKILSQCKSTFSEGQNILAKRISGRQKNIKSINGKSENLNYSLTQIYSVIQPTDNDLLVIFDADQIPFNDFLLRLVHNFDYDPKLALIVTPQMFSNADKYIDIFNHYNIQFWEYILPAFDCTNTIFCTGSNFIIRSSVLYQVGKMPQETVTEDFELGILLIQFGYKAKYFMDYLAIGEAPLDVKDIYKQRSRWTKGAFQILFKRNSPLLYKMTFVQKFMYTSCIYTYIVAIITYPLQQMVPIISLIIGVFPFYITIYSVVILIITILSQQLIGFYTNKKNKLHHILLFYYSGIAAYLYWYTYFKAIFRAFIGRITKNISVFKETPKTMRGASTKQQNPLNYTWPYHLLAFAQLIILIYVIIRNIAYNSLIQGKINVNFTYWPNLKKIDLFDISNICWMGINTIPFILLISYTIYRKIQNNIYYSIGYKKQSYNILKTICVSSFFLQKSMLILLGCFLFAILYKKVKQNDTYYKFYNNYLNQLNSQNQTPFLQTFNTTYYPSTSIHPWFFNTIPVPSDTKQEPYKTIYDINLHRLQNTNLSIIHNISDIPQAIVGNILPYFNTMNVSYTLVKNKTYNTTSFQMDYFDFPLNQQSTQKLYYLLSQCQFFMSICVIQIQTSNGYNYTNQSISDLSYIINLFRVVNFISFNREMNGQWYSWKAAPTQYIFQYIRFFDVLQLNLIYPSATYRLWNPNTQLSYPSYGLLNTTLPPFNSTDFHLMDTNHDGIIDSKDNAYSPFYPGNQFVDIISTSVYNFGSNITNGYNIIPPPHTVQNFLDTLYSFSVQHSKPFGILETGSLWIDNNIRYPKTNYSQYDVKKTWMQQIFNYTYYSNNTKFVLFMQEQKIENQLQKTCNNKTCSIQQQTVDWQFYNISTLTKFYIQQVFLYHFSINASSVFYIS